jgi:hypothetical protein
MGIILAKAKTFRKTGANESVDVTKRTSGIGQYLSPTHRRDLKIIKRL